MSNSIDKNLMNSVQVKRKLKSVNTDKAEIKNNLLNLVDQFQCLDRVAKSIGLIKEGFSFANRVSWKTIFSKLESSEEGENKIEDIELKDIMETVAHSSNQLEHILIPQLQKSRNNWMLEVLLIEFVVLGLLTLIIAGATHIQGLWTLSNFNFSFQDFFYERPIFSVVSGILLFTGFIYMHFSIRKFVAAQFVWKLKKESSEFDFVNAFLKNTRIQHSIFRPDIIGWNWMTKKCLQKI